MVTLLTGRDSDVETVLLGRKRTGGEGRVDARWVLGAVEVEDESARFVETVAGQGRVEKTACLIGGGLAGGVAKDKEETLVGRVFDDGFEAHGLAVDGDLGGAR